MSKYVKMKTSRELVRNGIIKMTHVSDDGEYCRYKILPNGPEIGEWMKFGEKLLVVDCDTIHENQFKVAPQLYEEINED